MKDAGSSRERLQGNASLRLLDAASGTGRGAPRPALSSAAGLGLQLESWDFSVLSQKQERLRERGSFRNNKELSCWRGIHSLASRHECSLLSKPHVFSFRKWDKTQNLEPGQTLSSVHQSPIHIPAHMPTPLLWVQCHQTQSPRPLKQSRWRGCAPCAPFSFLAQGMASPHPSFPRGFTEPSLGRRWPRTVSPAASNVLAYSFI